MKMKSNPRPAPKPYRIALMAWLLVLLLNYFFIPGFFTLVLKNGHLYGSIVDIFVRGAPVLLISLGMTLVIATGGVDLSVGAITAIAGAVAAHLLENPSWSALAVISAALGTALLSGAWNAMLVGGLSVQPIVATLVLMVAGRGIAQLITGGAIIAIDNQTFRDIGLGYAFGIPYSVSFVIASYALTLLVTRKTALGLLIESVGSSPEASRYVGINTGLYKGFTYLFCGLCSGLAGILICSNISAADANNSGLYMELDAILAVVIGGTSLLGGRFSLVGSFFGVLTIQTVATTMNTLGMPSQFTLMIKACVVIAVCLIHADKFRKHFSFRRFVQRRRTVS